MFIEAHNPPLQGEETLIPLSSLSDTELSQHIFEAAQVVEEAQTKYRLTGCFAAKGDVDHWGHALAEAVLERDKRKATR